MVLLCAAFAGGSAAQNYTASQCKWGLPILQPTNRSGDTWGLGWDDLLEVENIEVETADAMQVCTTSSPELPLRK